MKRVALLMLAASVVAGCAPQGPLGTVGAILTAPITAPVMFVSARMNDRDAFLESARRNDRPLPAIDARSKAKAGETLEQALERGMVDQGLYWQNRADAERLCGGWRHCARNRANGRRSGLPRSADRDRDGVARHRPAGSHLRPWTARRPTVRDNDSYRTYQSRELAARTAISLEPCIASHAGHGTQDRRQLRHTPDFPAGLSPCIRGKR